ncbi:antiviral reverse transcriptase Drt3a, partial [Vibrio anguillarum]
IRKDSLLGSMMIHKLNQLNKFLIDNSCSGLPRGLSISSTLSELYLRDFDSYIKSNSNVYYYARYVDDIIIICLDNVEEVDLALNKGLESLGLSVNEKYMVINDRGLENEFDYLGVKFRLSNKSSKYSLSTNKVKEIKTRVIKSIVDYRKNKDDELLINRIMFLTSNYKIHTKTESNNLKAGIYYNNQYITDYSQLAELNEFLRKSLTAKRGSLAKLVRLIPSSVVSQCIRMSFFEGYINKRMVSFSSKEISNIVRCWKHG